MNLKVRILIALCFFFRVTRRCLASASDVNSWIRKLRVHGRVERFWLRLSSSLHLPSFCDNLNPQNARSVKPSAVCPTRRSPSGLSAQFLAAAGGHGGAGDAGLQTPAAPARAHQKGDESGSRCQGEHCPAIDAFVSSMSAGRFRCLTQDFKRLMLTIIYPVR